MLLARLVPALNRSDPKPTPLFDEDDDELEEEEDEPEDASPTPMASETMALTSGATSSSTVGST